MTRRTASISLRAGLLAASLAAPAAAPVFDADPLNLFLVVETDDHHVSVLDGDAFEAIARFPTPYAVHGGPKFSPDGRFVFIMSRDGWVQKYDLWSLEEIGRIRAGINSRNIAISKDGRWLAVANYLPRTLTILSTDDLSVARIFEVAAKDGTPSRVSAVYQAPTRDSFVLALKDVPAIWEIATDPNAEPVYEGFVYSHEKGMVEALASSEGVFALRRIEVAEPIDDFFFDPSYRNLIGATRDGARGVVVNLDVRREIAELPLPGMPHLGSGVTWEWHGRRVMATPHLGEPRLSVIALDDWTLVREIETAGPASFCAHEESPYLWPTCFSGGTATRCT
jgi:Cytochrome D1 heme domain